VVHDASAHPTEIVTDAGEPDVLARFPELMELRDDDGERLGFVSVPLGSHEPRPIVVAQHGGSDRPERACPAWRVAAGGFPFVVCPRGWGGDEARLGWRSVADSNDRIARAIATVKKIFGAWVKDTSSVVLAGFSMGAIEVARLAESDPKTYRRIIIGDSAHDPRSALTFSRRWASAEGERALFLCTTSGCEPSMRAAAKRVAGQKTAASARLVVAPTQKHLLSDHAARSMRRDWRWLVDGAEGWDAYAADDDPPAGTRTESFDPP
jgi:pimeloyl-ACP methyl ester carboxylesterase